MRHNLRLRLAFKMAARLSMLSCRLVGVSLIFWLSLAEKYDGKQIAVTSLICLRTRMRTYVASSHDRRMLLGVGWVHVHPPLFETEIYRQRYAKWMAIN